MSNSIPADTFYWEEYHPGHRKADYFKVRLRENGDFERYSNDLFQLDENYSPITIKAEYAWRKEFTVSESGLQIIQQYIREHITDFEPKSVPNSASDRGLTVITVRIDKKLFTLELPGERDDPERYAFFMKVNDLIHKNMVQE